MIIALDIGYGYTKVFTQRGEEVIQRAFPSVTGNVENIRFTNAMIGTGGGKAIRYNQHRYWYGEMALLQSRISTTLLDRSRVSDDHAQMLFVAALVELMEEAPDVARDNLRVVTGLPVSYYTDRELLKEQVTGVHHVEVEKVTHHFNVEKVRVIPQPFGALFAALLNAQGEIADQVLANSSVGVIDVGTYTTDLVVMRPDDKGQPAYIEQESGSVSLGLSKVLELTQRRIADSFGLELSLPQTDKALQRGTFTVRDREYPITPYAQPHLAEVADAVLAVARELWGEGLALNRILVTGGGGALFQEQIKKVYPHAHLLEAPFWGNVRGFYRYGLRPRTFR